MGNESKLVGIVSPRWLVQPEDHVVAVKSRSYSVTRSRSHTRMPLL